jgi:hypothetical protein
MATEDEGDEEANNRGSGDRQVGDRQNMRQHRLPLPVRPRGHNWHCSKQPRSLGEFIAGLGVSGSGVL